MTIQELIQFKESENKVEFKEAKGGNFSYDEGSIGMKQMSENGEFDH
jgi:hypothetical protein